VNAAKSLPMTVAEFDDGKQATFKTAIAAAAGVLSADVTIVKIESISSARRGGAICHVAMRCLLAAGIRIDMSIKAANQNAGDTVGAKLTATAINAQLQQAGLPAATLLEAARTAPSGKGSSTSDGAGGNGMLPVIIGATVGLTVLLVIAFFLYRRCRQKVAETKCATAMSEVASAELGMCPPTAQAATLPDVEARVSKTKHETQRDMTLYDLPFAEPGMSSSARLLLAKISLPAGFELPAGRIFSVPSVSLEPQVLTHNHATAGFGSTSTVDVCDREDQDQEGGKIRRVFFQKNCLPHKLLNQEKHSNKGCN